MLQTEDMSSTTSNKAGRPLHILRSELSTIQTSRALAGKSVDAQITMLANKLDQASVAEREQTHAEKRERSLKEEEELNALTDGVGNLRCDDKTAWDLFDEIAWPKRDLWYDPRQFDGRR